MDSELMDRVKHLAKDGISAEFKIFGKAIVSLTDEIARLKEELKEAKEDIREAAKAAASAGAGAGAKPVIRMPHRPGAAAEGAESEGEEPEDGSEEETEGGPKLPPPPPNLGAFGG